MQDYTWKRGSPQIVVLRHLAANPSKKLHTKDRKMLNVIQAQAKAQHRDPAPVEDKVRRNERPQSRQIAAMRAGR
jgi:hypothetical protein